MHFTWLHRKQIDTERWDAVVSGSAAETIYPYSWYLDRVADHWSALVADDYRFIMPVVWRRKYGVRYIYQPLYTQQLGIFSKEYVDTTLIREMLMKLYGKFRFASMQFNTQNLVGEEDPFRVEDKTNYVLEMQPDYETLRSAFSTNARRNIKKADEINAVVDKEVAVEELVALKRDNDVIERSRKDYNWMKNLLDTIMEHRAGRIYGVRSGGKLCAAALFVFSRSRAIYMVSASGEQGKAERGMFRILDTFIREHAGSGLTLDFEGSGIPSVARFFAGFGATPKTYQEVTFSRVPFILHKIRKHG